MMKLPHHVLLITLLLDGGTPPATSATSARDGGSAVATSADGGNAARAPIVAEGIEWPDDLRPLATMDGPAVLAAHAALQRLLAGFPKEYAKDCSYTAKAMEVSVAQHGGLYFVEIKRNVTKCGW
ncbi:MAG: hypothetical protein EOO70_09995, partial [Myxococcaceae bacterium]